MLDTSKMLAVRGRQVKLREMFNTLQKYYVNNDNSRSSGGGFSRIGTGRYIINPKPYNPGYTYIAKGTYTGTDANTIANSIVFCDDPFYTVSGTKAMYYPPYGSLRKTTAAITTAATDISGLKNLAGYLTYKTVAEYMSQYGFTTATQAFKMPSGSTSDTTAQPSSIFLAHSETKQLYDESARFSNWIIPTITWYVGEGTRTTITGLRPYYIIAYTDSAYRGPRISTGIIPPFYTFPNSYKTYTNPQYFCMGIPYNGEGDNGLLYGLNSFGAGYVTGKIRYRGTADSTQYDEFTAYEHDLPLTYLWFNATTAELWIKPLTESFRGADAVAGGAYSSKTNAQYSQRVAYRSAQDVIDIFADAGIFVSTDIAEVYSPPITDDGIINPDEVDNLPYYPDNSTETTAITSGYVTPATFAQNLIYTPLATNNFLKWVCNNTVDITNWRRLFANPADVILGINLYNLDLVAHDSDNVLSSDTTNILGVSANIPNHFFRDGYNTIVDGGTCYIQAYYGNYADYTTMTYQCFVPFIGYISLRASDVVNKMLHLYYAVDFATGAANVFLNSDDKLIYTNTCNVASKIPLSTSDKNSQLLHNLMTTMSAGQAFANGFAGGQSNFKSLQAMLNTLSGLQLQSNFANRGSMSALNAHSLLPAFVERTRFDLFLPSDDQQYTGAEYQKYSGAPSTQFDAIVNCVDSNGYIESDVVYITSATATTAEKEEIINLIKSGIYL